MLFVNDNFACHSFYIVGYLIHPELQLSDRHYWLIKKTLTLYRWAKWWSQSLIPVVRGWIRTSCAICHCGFCVLGSVRVVLQIQNAQIPQVSLDGIEMNRDWRWSEGLLFFSELKMSHIPFFLMGHCNMCSSNVSLCTFCEVTAFLGDGIIFILFLVQRKSVVRRTEWTEAMKVRQRFWWTFRTLSNG